MRSARRLINPTMAESRQLFRMSMLPRTLFIAGMFGVLVCSPILASAQSPQDLPSAIEEIRAKIADLRQAITDLPRLTGVARASRISQILDELMVLRVRIVELRAHAAGGPALPSQRGSSGERIKELQELLGHFPDIYPEKQATGNFGPLTEKAVKKLQEKFGIESTGTVGPKTGEKISELDLVLKHRKPPKIRELNPQEGELGSVVNIVGTGFTSEGNAVFVRGRTILKGVPSEDGGTLIRFVLPVNLPCLPEQACPIKVINSNGISNARPFKVIFPPPPTEPPSPPEEPTPPPPPPVVPEISSFSPSFGPVGTEVTIYGNGFTSTGNAVNFGGLANAVTGLSSGDGVTLKFKAPGNTPCLPVNDCSVSVTNQNGTSNAVTFTLIQISTPVVVSSPNGGERWVKGGSHAIRWTGGTDAVWIALTSDAATTPSDPSGHIVGWISTSALPSSFVPWDGRSVCDSTGAVCSPVEPGSYKILAVSENEFGKMLVWNDALNQPANVDLSDQAFSILPEPSVRVLVPNGGEKWIHGTTVTIYWESTSILSRTVTVKLFKGGVLFRVISSGFIQGADTGMFFTTWPVPPDVPLGSDYTIEISDTANPSVRDWSDAPFSVAPKAVITVLAPNGGEQWFTGMKGRVRWSSSNILSKAVTIKLLQGGTVVRTLVSNLPQTYSWSTLGYTGGTFEYKVDIPKDIPAANDYSIEISDVADPSVRDVSDAPFSVIITPDVVTWTGRLVNHFTRSPLANTSLYNHAYYGPYLPQWSGTAGRTDSNGAFSVSTTTADGFWRKIPVGSWPGCYMNFWEFMDISPMGTAPEKIILRHGILDFIPDTVETLVSPTVAMGDIGMWPATGLYFHSDVPNSGVFPGTRSLYWPGVIYSADNTSYGGYQILTLEHDIQVRISDTLGSTYFSPPMKISLENGCKPVTLTFINNVFAWQPYNVTVSGPYLASYSVGTSVKVSYPASGGTSPYRYELFYGALPPGLTLDASTGAVSGIPTTLGLYKFAVKATDANGVIGGKFSQGVPFQIEIK